MLSLSAAVPAFSLQFSAPALNQRAAVHMTTPSGEDELLRRFGLPQDIVSPTRRELLGLAAGAAAISVMPGAAQADDGMFSLPPLPYDYVRPRSARLVPSAGPRGVSGGE